MNRPTIKAKLRSIISTPSTLLLGVIKSDISVKASPFNHLTEIYNMEGDFPLIDGRRKFPDAFASGSPTSGKSKRTEDIYIREDEDGIRSHYCPLNSKVDGIKDKEEAYTEFGYLETLNSSNSSTEDIPSFLVESSSSSESEESSFSVKYTRFDNQPATNENSPIPASNRILQLFQLHETKARLDEATANAWLEDSSDEMEYASCMKDSKLLAKHTVGDEREFHSSPLASYLLHGKMVSSRQTFNDSRENSDMEEFEEDFDSESQLNSSFIENNGQRDEKNKDVTIYPFKNDVENESSTGSSSEGSHSDSENEGQNENPSNLNTQNENEKEEYSENNSEGFSFAEDMLFSNKNYENEPESNLNVQDEYKDKNEEFQNDSKSVCILENMADFDNANQPAPDFKIQNQNKMKTKVLKYNTGTDPIGKDIFWTENKHENKCISENHLTSAIIYDGRHDGLDPSLLKSKAETIIKHKNEEKETNLITEPVEINISKSETEGEMQKDCTGSLYLETLTSVANKVTLKEKEIISNDLEKDDGLVFTDLAIKSSGSSGVFEPVLKEQRRKVSPKPRNKLTKFFQSFKKKLERNKKS